jgi:hypothetical protein
MQAFLGKSSKAVDPYVSTAARQIPGGEISANSRRAIEKLEAD